MGVSKKEIELQKLERLGMENINNYGDLMKIIEYNSSSNIIVEFQDKWKRTTKSKWKDFKNGSIRNPHDYERVGSENINYQRILMKCVYYKNAANIIIEFQDNYKEIVVSSWDCFKRGQIYNPYGPSIFGVGIVGKKYPTKINGKETKEFYTWKHIIERCHSSSYKEKNRSYKKAKCCDEWLLYENFYEWIHSQSNFDKWYDLERSAIDKDILVKGNKMYSPNTCCLVPININELFLRKEFNRGGYPIGVWYDENRKKFCAKSRNGFCSSKFLGYYDTPEEAFNAYKEFKENLIKQVAQEEYDKGNITKKCYDAMMNYEVEITD